MVIYYKLHETYTIFWNFHFFSPFGGDEITYYVYMVFHHIFAFSYAQYLTIQQFYVRLAEKKLFS